MNKNIHSLHHFLFIYLFFYSLHHDYFLSSVISQWSIGRGKYFSLSALFTLPHQNQAKKKLMNISSRPRYLCSCCISQTID